MSKPYSKYTSQIQRSISLSGQDLLKNTPPKFSNLSVSRNKTFFKVHLLTSEIFLFFATKSYSKYTSKFRALSVSCNKIFKIHLQIQRSFRSSQQNPQNTPLKCTDLPVSRNKTFFKVHLLTSEIFPFFATKSYSKYTSKFRDLSVSRNKTFFKTYLSTKKKVFPFLATKPYSKYASQIQRSFCYS